MKWWDGPTVQDFGLSVNSKEGKEGRMGVRREPDSQSFGRVKTGGEGWWFPSGKNRCKYITK